MGLARHFVEDSNLKFQVNALRRGLGNGRAGRRYIARYRAWVYSSIAPVEREAEPQGPSQAAPMTLRITCLLG